MDNTETGNSTSTTDNIGLPNISAYSTNTTNSGSTFGIFDIFS